MSENSEGSLAGAVLGPLAIIAFIGCCIASKACAAKEEEIQRKTAKEGYTAFLDEATIGIIERKTHPENQVENSSDVTFYVPRSGSHVADLQKFFKTEEGSYEAKGDLAKFKADFSFNFIKDEENGQGYHITGKRVDRYGQTTIEEGFMCNTGHAYWKEVYIVSNARHIVPDDSSAASYWDGPRVENISCVTKGRFTICDETCQGRMTFKGKWFCEHKDFPRGGINMKSQVFGSPQLASSVVTGEATMGAVEAYEVVPAEIVMDSN